MKPHRGTTILILGILSIICCGPLGIFAWVMGKSDIAAIDSGAMDPSGRQTTQIGMILDCDLRRDEARSLPPGASRHAAANGPCPRARNGPLDSKCHRASWPLPA